jgi:hypothetical protein
MTCNARTKATPMQSEELGPQDLRVRMLQASNFTRRLKGGTLTSDGRKRLSPAPVGKSSFQIDPLKTGRTVATRQH